MAFPIIFAIGGITEQELKDFESAYRTASSNEYNFPCRETLESLSNARNRYNLINKLMAICNDNYQNYKEEK